MSILVNRCVSLQVDPIISTSARSSISSSQRCLFHPSPSCLCFSCPPTLFPQGLKFLNQLFILSLEVSPFLSGVSHEDSNGDSSSSFSILFFSGGFNSSFLCWSYSFPCFKCFLMPVHLFIIHLSLLNCSGVLKISQKARLFILNPFNLFRGSYLIQAI